MYNLRRKQLVSMPSRVTTTSTTTNLQDQVTRYQVPLHLIFLNESISLLLFNTCHLVKCLKVLSEIYHYALIFRPGSDGSGAPLLQGTIRGSRPIQEDPTPYSELYRKYLEEESEHADATDRAYQRLYNKLCNDETCAIMDFIREHETSESSPEEKEKSATYKHLSMVSSMAKLVGARIKISERKVILDKMSFTQRAITYLLYIVFTLNAFITGFGLA